MKLRTWELDALQDRFQACIDADDLDPDLAPYLREPLAYDSGRWHPLGAAARAGRANVLRQMLQAGAPSDTQWNGGFYALLEVVFGEECGSCVFELAKAGASAGLRRNDGLCFFRRISLIWVSPYPWLMEQFIRGRHAGGWPLSEKPHEMIVEGEPAEFWTGMVRSLKTADLLEEELPAPAPTSGRRRL